MGVYCYTLRAGTRTIDGVEIGQTKFAYKCHWDDHKDPRVARQHKAAERARDKNPNLTRVIMGDWKYARSEPLAVFEISTDETAFYDTEAPGPVVGHVYCTNGRYSYKPVDA